MDLKKAIRPYRFNLTVGPRLTRLQTSGIGKSIYLVR